MSMILVVEDETGIRSMLTSLLRDEGYEVVATGDGRSAVSLAQEHHPDAVLLDVMLPGLDGRRVHQRLREIDGLKSTPVIFMSAAGQAAPVTDTNTSFVAKPFDLDQVLSEVASRVQ